MSRSLQFNCASKTLASSHICPFQELLALMKKKAEADARESLASADGARHSDTVSSATSLPDDAKELIAAMQSESEASSAGVHAEKAQKSRARRLTSTAVAVEAETIPQTQRLRESSGTKHMVGCDRVWGGGVQL